MVGSDRGRTKLRRVGGGWVGSDRNLNTLRARSRVVGVDPNKSSERTPPESICALLRVRGDRGVHSHPGIWNSFMRSRVLAFIPSDQKYVENVLTTFYELVVCILPASRGVNYIL